MARTTSRRTGRRERMAARSAKSAFAAPYTTRRIGKVSLIDDEAVSIIERNADRILDEIGMDFRGDPETLELFKKHGARVDGERVRFDSGWCRHKMGASHFLVMRLRRGKPSNQGSRASACFRGSI